MPFNEFFHIANLQKIYGKCEEKKVGVARLQPNTFFHDASKKASLE